MSRIKKAVFAAWIISLLPVSAPAVADGDIEALKQELRSLREVYESRIAKLEATLARIEETRKKTDQPVRAAPTSARRDVFENSFNPSIGLILSGQYRAYSSKEGEIRGAAVGEESARGEEGFSVEHTELNFSAAVDDKFFGHMTMAVAEHDGETEVELEEAYVQTLPGGGLPDGLSIKAGRAFWTFGYLNEHHAHADDFADRPLPYRVFVDEVFNDDGVELSYVLPTDLYAEIGGGLFRGDDFPFAEADGEGVGAWSLFARIGGDLGDNQSWRLGGYVLSGEAKGKRVSNEDLVTFIGDSDLYAADLRYVWAPTGNQRESEVVLQGEYFRRDEDGAYTEDGADEVLVDDEADGWYAQGVYKFHPQWRVGARYSRFEAPSVPAGLVDGTLDSQGYDPRTWSAMLDWSNSEFSRVRLQLNREQLARGQDDNQIILQYVIGLGAHGAHKY